MVMPDGPQIGVLDRRLLLLAGAQIKSYRKLRSQPNELIEDQHVGGRSESGASLCRPKRFSRLDIEDREGFPIGNENLPVG